MRASLVVIFLIRSKQMAEVPLAKHDDMVKAISADRTNQPLRICILPWRPRRNRSIPDAHRSKTTEEDIAIDAIPIANDISRRRLPAVGVGELAGNPFGVRMRSCTKPKNLTATMPQDQKSI